MTKLPLAWTALPLALACSTAEASRELLPSALDTTVAALVGANEGSHIAARRDPPQPSIGSAYVGLRRSYSSADMTLHACARLDADGSIVGHDCPAGVIAAGPRVVAPTHSDVRLRFAIASAGGVEIVSDIVSDDARRVHGSLDRQSVPANERRAIGYDVHVFEAAPAVEARIAVRGAGPIDFRISGLDVSVR